MNQVTISTTEYKELVETGRLYKLLLKGDLIKIKHVQTHYGNGEDKVIEKDQLSNHIDYINKVSFQKLNRVILLLEEARKEIKRLKAIKPWWKF